MPSPARYFFFGLMLAAGVIAADQLTKWWVFENMLRVNGMVPGFWDWLFAVRDHATFAREDFRSITVTSFFNLVVVWNRGVSFGLFGGGDANTPLILIGVAAVIAAGMLAWLYVAQARAVAVALALVIGGAVGNIIDRAKFGAVADFIDIHAMGYHWPAFNVADSAIVIGAALLMVDAVFWHDKRMKTLERKERVIPQ